MECSNIIKNKTYEHPNPNTLTPKHSNTSPILVLVFIKLHLSTNLFKSP